MKNAHSNETQKSNIPRPLNCFLIYRNEKQKEILAQCPGANHRDLSKIIATWWKNATALEKEPFKLKARIAKQEHNEKYPGYKYAPKRKDGPKRAYIRKIQHEKFTSKSQERNILMDIIYGQDVVDKVTPQKTKCIKKKVKKTKLPKAAAPPEQSGYTTLSNTLELSPYILQYPFENVFGYYVNTVNSSCSTSVSTGSPIPSSRSETPNTERLMSNYFNQDLEECLSFPPLNAPLNTINIGTQDCFNHGCIDCLPYQTYACRPAVDYNDPMYFFSQLL